MGDPVVLRAIKGLLFRQFDSILMDSYANAFNREGDWQSYRKDHTKMGPYVWERKYEMDSLAFPLYLLDKYYRKTHDTTVFTDKVTMGIESILHTWTIEQRHSEASPYRFERDSDLATETLANHGLGSPIGYTGMSWSGFRPSDDACAYNYLIPSNMLAVSVLNAVSALPVARELCRKAKYLAEEITSGINQYAVVEHPKYGKIFVYECDGLGNYLLMDDANLPSLLGIPLFGFCDISDPIYKNTRRFLLSQDNPYYFEGTFARGIGSPHTPHGYIWPIALIVQWLTETDSRKRGELLEMLKTTTAGTDYMHESFDPNEPESYTRPWFAWANSMFCWIIDELYNL
jgi:meiotically up-regulated gene 157 (Mug157) protein